MNKYKTIGILGGMGPEATAELYKRIINICQNRYNAVDDADYPNIIINSVPVEDMLNNLDNRRTTIVGQLQNAVDLLVMAGVELIAIPCNTATMFIDELRSNSTVPIIDITEIAVVRSQLLGNKKVGMLASSSTIKTKIYEDKLDDVGIEMVRPSQVKQREVNQIIMRILAGEKNIKDQRFLKKLSREMSINGATAVILGCTELPLIVNRVRGIPVIDTLELLAEKTVEMSTKKLTIGSED